MTSNMDVCHNGRDVWVGVIKQRFMDVVETYSAVLGACVMLGPASWGEESLFGMVNYAPD
jgi:hypothetical protein